MSHASLLETLDTGSIWSVARGLARNVSEYKQHLMNCDSERRNDLDGRGHRAKKPWLNLLSSFCERQPDGAWKMHRTMMTADPQMR